MKKQTQKLTVENSSFRMNQKIEITGQDFAMFNIAMDETVNSALGVTYPLQFKYVDANGEPVEEYTEEQVASGAITKVLDIFKTFNPNNAVEAYGNINPMVLEAKRNLFQIHHKEASEGRTISNEKLIEEYNATLKPVENE